jgi:hypothetical protein
LHLGVRAIAKLAEIGGEVRRAEIENPEKEGLEREEPESERPESERPEKVAFIGLGVMGYPMAGHLARAGGSQPPVNGPVKFH